MLASQIILSGLILILFIKTLISYRKNALPSLFMIFWLVFWLIILALILHPAVLSPIAHLLGIGRGVDLAVYISVIFIFYAVYVLFVRITFLENKLTESVRKETLKKAGINNNSKSDQ